MYIDLTNKSIDYLTAISDVRKSIAHRRERDWSWDTIAQMLEGLGQLADVEINLMLEDLADRLEERDPPPGYGRTKDGKFFKLPPTLGTEADHPDYNESEAF